MAKITGPFLALGASGTIAQTLTASKWKGRPYIRQRVVPANPDTASQQSTRNVFRAASAMWKQMETLLVAPWDSNAQGQVKTGRNVFIGDYVQNLRGDADYTDLNMSPGSKGGLAPTALSLTPISAGMNYTITAPSTPTGWTLQAAIITAIADQDPALVPATGFATIEDTTPPFDTGFVGLSASTAYAFSAWLRWLKPDGQIAYGASITDLATTLA